MTSIIGRRPLTAFFVLAFALSWWPAVIVPFGEPFPGLVGFGPFIAALVVLAATVGKTGVVDLLRRMVRWRVDVGWWVAALLLPLVVAGAATGLNVLLGAAPPSAAELAAWPTVLPIFALFLLVPGVGGAWEEPGFRGYALPRMADHRSPLAGGLLLGIVWAVWHLPLYLAGRIEWPDVGAIVATSVVYAWLVFGTRGSVLLAMVMHAANNTVNAGFFSPMFAGDDAVQQAALLSLVWVVAAVAVTLAAGPAFRAPSEQGRFP